MLRHATAVLAHLLFIAAITMPILQMMTLSSGKVVWLIYGHTAKKWIKKSEFKPRSLCVQSPCTELLQQLPLQS